jgi:hypothetical protein
VSVSVAPPFRLPNDGRSFTEQIIMRCEDLINYQIWGGLHVSRLRRWMANFVSDEERYFGACVLDAFIYRSHQQTIALMRHLFQRTLPDLFRLDPPPCGRIDDLLQLFRTRSFSRDPGIRLVHAVKESDPLTKSAPEMGRFMRRNLGIWDSWLIKPGQIAAAAARNVQVFVFFDDFLGTGDQFSEFLHNCSLGSSAASLYLVYSPLAAHTKGGEELARTFPYLRVVCVEPLDATYAIFSVGSHAFDDGLNSPDSAREFYFELLKRKGIRIGGPDRRGYGHLELAYAFEHGTPDNSLPLLWWRDTPEFTPLLDR